MDDLEKLMVEYAKVMTKIVSYNKQMLVLKKQLTVMLLEKSNEEGLTKIEQSLLDELIKQKET